MVIQFYANRESSQHVRWPGYQSVLLHLTGTRQICFLIQAIVDAFAQFHSLEAPTGPPVSFWSQAKNSSTRGLMEAAAHLS